MKKLYFSLVLIFMWLGSLAQTYNYYYGNLHSHSDYSDGNQDKASSGLSLPWQDFNFAKSSYHMDFLGISEHNHSNAGMALANFSKGFTQADTTTTASFISLYGMEWGVTTNSYDGHVLIYGVNQLIGWEAGNYDVYCAKSDYPSLWPIINGYSNSFATLCHPSNGQFQNLDGTSLNTDAETALVGCVVRSGAAFSTTTDYSDAPATLYETYFRKLLAKGYHIGPTIDHDNHNTTFGRTAKTRTVVLATSLSAANIIDAYRNMRFYASDDWNAQVSFTVGADQMGSVINTYGSSNINVTVTDPDAGDNVSAIQVYYGVPGSGTAATVLTSNSSSSSLNYTHTTSVGDNYYYYAKITQADGDIMWTAPIWITRLNSALPVTNLQVNAAAFNSLAKINWSTTSEMNVAGYEIEKAYRGNDFHKIGYTASINGNSTVTSRYSFIDSTSVPGMQFYRIKQIDRNGVISYSDVVALNIQYNAIKILAAGPNPTQADITYWLQSDANARLQFKLYNEEGRLAMQLPVEVNSGQNTIQIKSGSLPAGLYFVVIEKDYTRIIESKFVKE